MIARRAFLSGLGSLIAAPVVAPMAECAYLTRDGAILDGGTLLASSGNIASGTMRVCGTPVVPFNDLVRLSARYGILEERVAE